MGTRVSSRELHLTIFHMRVQYVYIIRNVHVEYTDHLPRVIQLTEVAQYFLELSSPVEFCLQS